MNKKGQAPDIEQIIVAFFGVIMFIAFFSILPSILNPCNAEKSRINDLESQLGICQSQIQNQTALESALISECNNKINESTYQCNEDLELNINIVKNYKQIFVIYHITIALSLILAFNLFKGFLRFEIKVKNKKLKIFFKGVQFVWVGLKWIMFIGFALLFLLCLFILLFPHWFF